MIALTRTSAFGAHLTVNIVAIVGIAKRAVVGSSTKLIVVRKEQR